MALSFPCERKPRKTGKPSIEADGTIVYYDRHGESREVFARWDEPSSDGRTNEVFETAEVVLAQFYSPTVGIGRSRSWNHS